MRHRMYVVEYILDTSPFPKFEEVEAVGEQDAINTVLDEEGDGHVRDVKVHNVH